MNTPARAIVLAWFVLVAVAALTPGAHADTSTSSPPTFTASPGCTGAFRHQICDLPDGSGGVCVAVRCADGQPCFTCLPAPPPTSAELYNTWPALLAFGGVVFLVGLFLWFQVRRRWSAMDREQAAPRPPGDAS